MITLFHLIYYTVNILYNVFKQRIFGDVEKFQNAQYLAVLKILFDEKWEGRIKKVLNFVNGDFSFVPYLKNFHDHCEVLAVDISSEMSEISKFSIKIQDDHTMLQTEPLDVSIIGGNISDPEERLSGTDAVVCMNILEYIYPKEHDILPYNIFGFVRPRLAVFTALTEDIDAPISNSDLNCSGRYKFRWTSDQFQEWALNIVNRFTNYSVKIENRKLRDGRYNTYCLAVFSINFGNEELHKKDCDISYNSTCLETICIPDQIKNDMDISYLIPGKDKNWFEKVLHEAENHISVAGDIFGQYFNDDKVRAEVPLSRLMLFLKDLCTIDELKSVLISSGWVFEECFVDNHKELCVIYDPQINCSSIDSNESIFNTDTDKLEDNDFSDWEGEYNSYHFDPESPIDSEFSDREFYVNVKNESKLKPELGVENVDSSKKNYNNSLSSKTNFNKLDIKTLQRLQRRDISSKFNSFDSELFSLINKTSLKESQTFDGNIYDILKDLSKNEIKPIKHSVTCNMINKIVPEHSDKKKENSDIDKQKTKAESSIKEENKDLDSISKIEKQKDDKDPNEPHKSSCSDAVSISEASLEHCNSVDEQNDLLFDSGYQKSNLELSPQSPIEFYVGDDFDDKSEMEQADLKDCAMMKQDSSSDIKLKKKDFKNDSDKLFIEENIDKEDILVSPEIENHPMVEVELEVPVQPIVENQEIPFRAPIVENGDLINNNRDYEGNNYEERFPEPNILVENDNDLIPQQVVDVDLDADNENHIVIEDENQEDIIILHGEADFGEDMDLNYVQIIQPSGLSLSTNDSASSIPDSMTDIESEEDIEEMPEDPFPEWLLLLLNNPNDFHVDFLSRGDSLSVNPEEDTSSSSSDEPVSIAEDFSADEATAVDEGIELSEVYYDSIEEIPSVRRQQDGENT